MMSFEVIHSVEYNTLFKQKQIPNGTIHAINSVILGNEVYYIEPQTREIIFVAYLGEGRLSRSASPFLVAKLSD